MYFAETIDAGIGLGTPSIGVGISGAYFSDVNKPEDLNGWVGTLGGTFKIVGIGMGADIHFNLSKNKKLFSGIRLSPSVLLKSIFYKS